MKSLRHVALSVAALCTLSMGMHAAQATTVTEPQESTTQELFADTNAALVSLDTASIVLTGNSGVKMVNTLPGAKVEAVLKEQAINPADYRTESGLPISGLTIGSNALFLFKIEYEGSLKKLEIPPAVEKINSPMMVKGKTVVLEPGQPGLGILTTVAQEDLSQATVNKATPDTTKTIAVESLTVITQPTIRKILVGTATQAVVDAEAKAYPDATEGCTNGSTVPTDIQPELIAIHDDICSKFPDIAVYGTHRGSCTFSCDHHDGYAMDIMVNGERGWEVAEYLREKYEAYNISYLIYSQKIWADYRQIWKPMADRGSTTANHYDHVHVSLNR